jgi:hypothetical protein
MYEQNIARANNSNASQRMVALSLNVSFSDITIIYLKLFDRKFTKKSAWQLFF